MFKNWFRSVLIWWALAAFAFSQGFRFTIGGPAAAQDFVAKTAAFAFRTEGCADPGALQISGTAEGLVNGTRRSVALKVAQMSKPGVYAVFQTWSGEGVWVANLKGVCGKETAGAIVPLGPKGFIRDLARFFPRAAAEAEIGDSLKTLARGESK